MSDYGHLEKWYKRVTWFGIFLNMLFVIPTFFFPAWILRLLDLEFEPMIWAQTSGMLLFIISAFYVPAALDLKRYRASAWLAIIPSRFCGFSFFYIAVFFFNCPIGFLPISLIDLMILFLQLVILLNIRRVESAQPPYSKLVNGGAVVGLFAFIVVSAIEALRMG